MRDSSARLYRGAALVALVGVGAYLAYRLSRVLRLQNSGDFSPPASSQTLGAQAKSDTGPITLMLDS